MDLMWWLFAQEVLHMHGISSEPPRKVLPHRCFHRDPEKTAKEEQATVDKTVTKEEFQVGWTAPVLQFMSVPPDLGV